MRANEVQVTPLVFVKYNVPDPRLGTAKVKFVPTPSHPEGGQVTSLLLLTPLMMTFGSIPSAKAITDPTTSTRATAQT